MPNVFISHAALDRAFVETEIVPALKSSGISTWYSTDDIGLAAQWEREIRKGLESCDWFIVVVSPNALASKWVRIEVNWAVEHRFDRIVPVLLETCNPTNLSIALGQIQYVDYRQDQPKARARLLKVWGIESNQVPVLAVMGAKGGVGKTTIVSCIAQMIAELGHDVAILDFDILDEGATNEAKRYFPVQTLFLKTVYDHIAPHSSWTKGYRGPNDTGLCRITPKYLRDRKLGDIWLLPAREKTRNKQPFQVLSNLIGPQPELLRKVTREILERVRAGYPNVRLILIDCGAGKNTLFAAAFAEAQKSLIVTLPNRAYFDNIAETREELVSIYPEVDLDNVLTIVNRVTCKPEIDLCSKLHPEPIAFVPFDPTVERDSNLLGSVEYGLGYNDVFLKLREALESAFFATHAHLVPDQFEVRLKPWVRILVENRLAEATLKSPKFWLLTVISWLTPLLMVLIMVGLFLNRLKEDSPGVQQTLKIIIWLSLVASVYWLIYVQDPRRRLLKRLARLPAKIGAEHKHLLNKLLMETDRSFTVLWFVRPSLHRSLLRYVKKLVDESIAKEKTLRLLS